MKLGGHWSKTPLSCVCMFSGPLCDVRDMVAGDETWGIVVSDVFKPEAVSPEDPPETGCSPTITLLPV